MSVFIQCQYTRTILRHKNMGQSLFKKHSKFQNSNELFYCGMTRLRNANLDVFIQFQYTRTIWRKSQFKKRSKFLIFNKAFYCNMAKLCTNNTFLENIFTQKLLSERKLWDKIILENVLGVTVSVNYFNASSIDEWTQTIAFFVKSNWILF